MLVIKDAFGYTCVHASRRLDHSVGPISKREAGVMKVRITAIIPTEKGTDLVAESAGCRADWAGLRDRMVREARTIGLAEARQRLLQGMNQPC